jgi:hypothetical protein
MDGIFKIHHPIAAWTMDDDFSTSANIDSLDSFYYSSVVVSAISTISSGKIEVTTSTNHNLVVGDIVEITGVKPQTLNNRYVVQSITNSTKFKVDSVYAGPITLNGKAIKGINAYRLNAYNKPEYPGYALITNPSNTASPIPKLQTKTPLSLGSYGAKYGSVLIPSAGFLSSNGRYNQYTLETWIKLKRYNSSNIYKIVGLFNNNNSIDDGNGLYYNNTSFILKIGDKTDAVFVKQINKPILIQLTYSSTSASLFINGEELISLQLEKSDIDMLTDSNKQYISLQSAVFDSIVLYPYKLTKEQTMINYALGQAVVPDRIITRTYGGKIFHIDFPSANYPINQSYPKSDISWNSKIKENLNISKKSLSNKEFALPEFNFKEIGTGTVKTIDDYLNSGSTTWNFSSSFWSGICSNVQFLNLDILDSPLSAFYLDAYVNFNTNLNTTFSLYTTERTIFKIIDKYTGNYFRIGMYYNASKIYVKYYIKYNSVSETLMTDSTVPATPVSLTQENIYAIETATPNKYHFLIGIDVTKFKTISKEFKNLFADMKNLTMFMLGDNDLSESNYKTPNLNIVNFKILTDYTKNKDGRATTLIDASGRFFCPSDAFTTGSAVFNKANNSPGTYELKLILDKLTYNASHTYSSNGVTNKYFATGSFGYFKTDIPLKSLSSITKNLSNENVESLDFIQFNIDYDAPIVNTASNYFDTSLSNIKTYVTFEQNTNGNNPYNPDSFFSNGTKSLHVERTILPDANWATTKYEVVDGTIIYIPTGIDIDRYSLVYHLDVVVSDTTNNTVDIKSIEFAPKTLNSDGTKNPIGTKYSEGGSIIPYTYTLSGTTKVYDYKAYNPYLIYKISNPYLSLDRLTGIKLVGFNNTTAGVYRGLRILHNQTQSKKSQLNVIQLMMYYDAPINVNQGNRESFQFDSKEIFNIVTKDKTLTAALTNSSGTPGLYYDTATLAITSPSATTNENIQYFINGQSVVTPTIKTNEWTMLTMIFRKPLNFDEFIGEFNITGPVAFDSISLYDYPLSTLLRNSRNQTWNETLNPSIGSQYTWNYWTPSPWVDVMFNLDQGIESISANSLYGLYTKTNVLYGTYNNDYKTTVLDSQYQYDKGYTSEIKAYPAN